eukprot:6997913-Pyramimonas_sp.AAC.1
MKQKHTVGGRIGGMEQRGAAWGRTKQEDAGKPRLSTMARSGTRGAGKAERKTMDWWRKRRQHASGTR